MCTLFLRRISPRLLTQCSLPSLKRADLRHRRPLACRASWRSSASALRRRPGAVVGKTLEGFDPENDSVCNPIVKKELLAAGYELPSDGCYARILVVLDSDFDMGIGDIVQDIGADFASSTTAIFDELANAAFTKGAELTKFVIGKIVAKIAVIEKLFAKETHTEKLCVSDKSGAETCLSKQQLDALLAGAAVPTTPPPSQTSPAPETEPQDEPIDESVSVTPSTSEEESGASPIETSPEIPEAPPSESPAEESSAQPEQTADSPPEAGPGLNPSPENASESVPAPSPAEATTFPAKDGSTSDI